MSPRMYPRPFLRISESSETGGWPQLTIEASDPLFITAIKDGSLSEWWAAGHEGFEYPPKWRPSIGERVRMTEGIFKRREATVVASPRSHSRSKDTVSIVVDNEDRVQTYSVSDMEPLA